MKKSLIALTLLYTTIEHCFAGGFQVNLQGQKQTGMGHTGTGLLLDASSILFNPGAVSFLDTVYSISIGSSFIIPRTQYLESSPGIYTEQTASHIGTPFTFYTAFKLLPKSALKESHRKGDKLFFGLGVYTPFGSRVQWPDNWKGQALMREIDLKTIFIQPTVSYKINKKWGIGGGPIFATGNFSLRRAVPIQDSSGKYGEALLQGKAMGFGFNIGVYYRANEKLSIGIDYRSQVKVSVKNGDASFTVPSSLAQYFPNTNFNTAIKLPQMITLGFGYHVNKKLTLALDVNYIGWKCYDTLRIDFEDTTSKLKNIRSARMYKNVFIYRIGAQYKISEMFTVRVGAYFDSSPVNAGYLTPETPDANKIGITAGASIHISDKINLDLSLLYIEATKRTDTNMETQFSGTYKTRAIAPGFSLEFVF